MIFYYILKSFYLYAISMWSGSAFFMTLFSAPAAFKVFKKEDAGKFTEFLLGKYFYLCFVLSFLSLVSFYLLTKNSLSFIPSINLFFITTAAILNFLKTFFLYPKLSKLKAAYYQTKIEEKYKDFLKLHKISVILNIVVLILTWLSLGITSLYLTF